MKLEKGVMVMKDGKAWGVIYADGYSKEEGWISPEDATIYNPEYVKKPEDVPYERNPFMYERNPFMYELKQGAIVFVERRTEVFIKDSGESD